MAKTKRNAIELVTGFDEEKDQTTTKVYYTSPYLSGRLFRDALSLSKELEESEEEMENLDKLLDFVANDIYGSQFTVEELEEGLPPYRMVEELQEQVFFVARGEQSDTSKKLLEQKT